jgi:hypothetical protein
MLNKTEKSILEKIAENQLITKPELRKYLETNGGAGRDTSVVVDTITKRLMEQKLVSSISPVGSTCYIITQRGAQMLRDSKE